MTTQEILDDVFNHLEEYLEMMTVEEKFILIRNTLAQKLSYEIAEKEYYKSLSESLCRGKGVNS